MGEPIPPPRACVAVLGGGQLGRMLGLAGIPMGLRFRFLDPVAGAPAGAVGDLVVGGLGDRAALDRVAEGAHVVTYEWEGVPADGARYLADRLPLFPSARSLAVSQDRVAEKRLCGDLGIATAPFAAVDDRAALHSALGTIGTPAILKTRSGGYDGKGQFRLDAPGDADAAWDALGPLGHLVLEARVAFTRELSVLACRGRDGEVAVYPVAANIHEGGILRVSRVPTVGRSSQAAAAAIARRLLEALDHVGVLCVELFETGDGSLVVNELAPRVHNSGHWTIEGAVTSQFENHLRAILGLPLGAPTLVMPNAMVNCIGALPDREAILGIAGAHLHDYDKSPRAERKVGHVTVLADDEATLDERLDRVEHVIRARPSHAAS